MNIQLAIGSWCLFGLTIRSGFVLLHVGGQVNRRSYRGKPVGIDGGWLCWWQRRDSWMCGQLVSRRGWHWGGS